MANYLTKLRTDPKYFHVKAQMETALERIPVAGNAMVKALQGGKQLVRRGIYHSTMFEEMGFQYIGPVDGHDVLPDRTACSRTCRSSSPPSSCMWSPKKVRA